MVGGLVVPLEILVKWKHQKIKRKNSTRSKSLLEENSKWTRDFNKSLENRAGNGDVLTDETVRRKLLPRGRRGGRLLSRALGRLWAQSQQVSRNGEDGTGQETENEVMTAFPPHLPRPPYRAFRQLGQGQWQTKHLGFISKGTEPNVASGSGRWLVKASKVNSVSWSTSSSLGLFGGWSEPGHQTT